LRNLTSRSEGPGTSGDVRPLGRRPRLYLGYVSLKTALLFTIGFAVGILLGIWLVFTAG